MSKMEMEHVVFHEIVGQDVLTKMPVCWLPGFAPGGVTGEGLFNYGSIPSPDFGREHPIDYLIRREDMRYFIGGMSL